MKTLGLISSPTDPASRARIIQYKEHFKDFGEDLIPRFFLPYRESEPAPWTYHLNKITGINQWRTTNIYKFLVRFPLLIQQYNYDIIWQNRLILPHYSFFEKKIHKPLVFDFDDAIWMNEGDLQVKEAISSAAMVFAGNEYLADYASKLNSNVHIVPTTVDTEKIFPLHKEAKNFTIGWIGSESNFKYLDIIKSAVLDFLSENTDTRFTIISSKKPLQFNFDNDRIIFKKWSAEKENELINEFSVGLMPLEDNTWTKGKCSFKMLQYMACGKPVIVSPVGTNSRILSESSAGLAALNKKEWLTAFGMLKNEAYFYKTCAGNGRTYVENNYSCKKMTPVIINLFKTIIN